jgi:hypothetical protein
MPQHSRLFASRDRSAPRPQTQAARPTEPGRRLSPSLGAALALAACLVAANLLSPQMHAQSPAAGLQRTALRHQQAVPQLQGTDGTETGTADFLGNFTTISTPSGALSVFRRADCSLSLATGTYTIEPTFTYMQTELAANYELVLHSEAQLTTTPDIFANSCAMQPVPGFGSQPGIFVGTTTTGVNVFAGLGLTYPSLVNGVYLLTGTTTFTLSSFQFSSAGNLTAADLNKDGNGDLVILDDPLATTGRVTVMLGNADGTFQNAVTYPIAGNYSVAAVIDDVNNDGKLDIVAVSGDQQISVLLGNGDGTFQPAQSFAAPALPGYASAASTPIQNLITADVNNDGNKDIICSNGLVLLGNGTGAFTPVATPAFPYAQDNLYAGGPNLASGDLNNDGKIDLVVNNSNSISTWIGKGDGTFIVGPSYATINTDGFITVDDLDGDGNPDIYVGLGDGGAYGGDEGSPGLAYALMGNGNSTFQGAPLVNGGGAYNGKNLSALNSDTTPDLVTLNAASNGLVVETGNGTGNFNPAFTNAVAIPASLTLDGNAIGTASATISDFALGDLNGDGKPDLAFVVTGLTFNGGASEYGSPVFFTALNNGDGTFATPVVHEFSGLIPPGANNQTPTISGVRIAGFVKNGHGDVLFSFITPGTYSNNASLNEGFVVYPGDGTGNFGTAQITYTYQSTTTPTILAAPQVAAAIDLNNDQVPDLLAVVPTGISNGFAQTTLEEFRGNGDGTFATPTTINCAPNPYLPAPPVEGGAPFVLADFNKDGNTDLACVGETTAGQGELAIATGNGDGTFNAPTVLDIAGGDTARSAQLAAADFDGDGNIDLALFDSAAWSGIFYGKGDGTFSYVDSSGTAVPKDLINIFSQSSTGIGAVAVDLNNDGKPDILSANAIYLNAYSSTTTTLPSSNTALSALPTTAIVGASIAFTANVTGEAGTTGTPTGIVTFMDGPTTLAAVTLVSGQAAYATTALAVGVHDITAVYSGDVNFAGSTSSLVTVTINSATPVNTTTSLTASATSALVGASLTFSAAVTPASGSVIPAGTVIFMDGGSAIGVENLDANGHASLITSALLAGVHSITAQYTGNGSFNPSTSSAISVTISALPVDFTFTISASSGAVTTTSPTDTATLTVTPQNGFSAAVNFACSGLPSDVTCAFYPTTLTPGDGLAATTAVTFTESTKAQLDRNAIDRSGGNTTQLLYAGFGLGGVMLLFGIRRRRGLFRVVAILVAALSLAGLVSCGSSGSGSHQLQNSTVTITATSGTLSHSVTYTLTSN